MDGAASDEDVVYHRVEAHAVRRDDGVCATESDRKSDDDTRDTWEGGGVRRERGIRDVGQWEEKLFTGLCQGEALEPSSGLSLAWLQPHSLDFVLHSRPCTTNTVNEHPTALPKAHSRWGREENPPHVSSLISSFR